MPSEASEQVPWAEAYTQLLARSADFATILAIINTLERQHLQFERLVVPVTKLQNTRRLYASSFLIAQPTESESPSATGPALRGAVADKGLLQNRPTRKVVHAELDQRLDVSILRRRVQHPTDKTRLGRRKDDMNLAQ